MSTGTLVSSPTQPMRAALWAAQLLPAAFYGAVGAIKLIEPIPELAAMMVWPGVVAPAFVRFVGAAELAGALGIVLPMLTGIARRLTLVAAYGLVALQLCAMVFHSSRGEFSVLPINLVLLALPAFVAWGRRGLSAG